MRSMLDAATRLTAVAESSTASNKSSSSTYGGALTLTTKSLTIKRSCNSAGGTTSILKMSTFDGLTVDVRRPQRRAGQTNLEHDLLGILLPRVSRRDRHVDGGERGRLGSGGVSSLSSKMESCCACNVFSRSHILFAISTNHACVQSLAVSAKPGVCIGRLSLIVIMSSTASNVKNAVAAERLGRCILRKAAADTLEIYPGALRMGSMRRLPTASSYLHGLPFDTLNESEVLHPSLATEVPVRLDRAVGSIAASVSRSARRHQVPDKVAMLVKGVCLESSGR